MATYDEILQQTIQAYQTLAQQNPDLVNGELDPGAEVVFTVDSDLGAVNVIVRVPAPLAPPAGQAKVQFRPGTPVEVSVTPSE